MNCWLKRSLSTACAASTKSLDMATEQMTEGEAPPAVSFDIDRKWSLHSRVALRPEPFGAMAYHYDSRRLNFLRSPDLVVLVERLGDYDTAAQALTTIDEKRRPAFTKALASLAASNFLESA